MSPSDTKPVYKTCTFFFQFIIHIHIHTNIPKHHLKYPYTLLHPSSSHSMTGSLHTQCTHWITLLLKQHTNSISQSAVLFSSSYEAWQRNMRVSRSQPIHLSKPTKQVLSHYGGVSLGLSEETRHTTHIHILISYQCIYQLSRYSNTYWYITNFGLICICTS